MVSLSLSLCLRWYAHFDGEWIARQMELHPDKPPILLVAGEWEEGRDWVKDWTLVVIFIYSFFFFFYCKILPNIHSYH